MFYGGRLLNHLAVDDPDVERFIELRRLNQNLILVMDSDRDKSPHQHLKATKSRVRRAIENSRGIAWVTSGREIENYVAAPIMKAAVKTVRPTARPQTGRFDRVLPRNVDKLRVARAVADMPADLDVLDLKDRIRDVIAFIEKANA